MGYRGPAFSYARMPDQYTWKHFYDQELAARHDPVLAEIDFVSSHTPWTPLPSLVPWAEVGDGSVFDPQPARGTGAGRGLARPANACRRLYGKSVEYTLGAMFSFLHTYDQPNLVLIVLGDHQPARIVSGPDADHDVPITIISKDPSVFDAIASWRWDAGVTRRRRTPRCGGWTSSATGSSRPSARETHCGVRHSGPAAQTNPSGSVSAAAAPLISSRCDPPPSASTPATFARARRW